VYVNFPTVNLKSFKFQAGAAAPLSVFALGADVVYVHGVQLYPKILVKILGIISIKYYKYLEHFVK
jgi:energy-converting hydrogenase Eha subunit A